MRNFNVGDIVRASWGTIYTITTREAFEEYYNSNVRPHNDSYFYIMASCGTVYWDEGHNTRRYTIIKRAVNPLNAFESVIYE